MPFAKHTARGPLSAAALLMLALTVPASALAQRQVPDPDQHFWMDVNAGLAGGTHFSGISLGINASYLRGRHLFTARVMGLESTESSPTHLDFNPSPGSRSLPERKTSLITEVGLLYGRALKGRWGVLSASAGVGLVRGDERFPDESFTAVGLPVGVEAFFRPLPGVGMGLRTFANLNAHASFLGLGLGFQLGN